MLSKGDNHQTSSGNYKPQETIISVQNTKNLTLSTGDLNNLRLLDEALEDNQIQYSTAKPLIQRVPSRLRENKHFMKYFTPKTIAIGPLHHDDLSLQGAQKLKLKLAAYFVRNQNLEKEILYNKIKMETENLKKCYDPNSLSEQYRDDRNNEKLTWMFFVDGLAVLQAIYIHYGPQADTWKETLKKLNMKNDLLTFVYIDMFLLENQIPYRVLQLLTSTSDVHCKNFEESIKKFLDDNDTTPKEVMKEQQRRQQRKRDRKRPQQQQQQEKVGDHPAHLLECLRDRLVVTEQQKISQFQRCCWDLCLRYQERSSKRRHCSPTFRNVKELQEAGIWLRPSETNILQDVSFSRVFCVGKLSLPAIEVDDSTGLKFMNLVAFEMCPDFIINNDFEVTSYICFLDTLIDEAGDVKALRDAGILHNALGSDGEVAELFNKMNTDLVPSSTMYYNVTMQIHNHCKNKWINYAAQAYHTHFRSPWTFLAFAGAIAALVLSALQTYYTIHDDPCVCNFHIKGRMNHLT